MLITTKANIASVSAIGLSRRVGFTGLLPESPIHPRSGKSSTAQLPRDLSVQLVLRISLITRAWTISPFSPVIV